MNIAAARLSLSRPVPGARSSAAWQLTQSAPVVPMRAAIWPSEAIAVAYMRTICSVQRQRAFNGG